MAKDADHLGKRLSSSRRLVVLKTRAKPMQISWYQKMKGYVLIVVSFFCLLKATESSDASPSSQVSHHRVRRFLFTQNSTVSFDINLALPIPMLGSIDIMAVFEIPLTVTMLNDTFQWNPIQIPFVVLPPPLEQPVQPFVFPNFLQQNQPAFPNFLQQNPQVFPVFNNFPDLGGFGQASQRHQQFQLPSPSGNQQLQLPLPSGNQQQFQLPSNNQQATYIPLPSENQPAYGPQDNDIQRRGYDPMYHPSNIFHHRMKKSLAAASAQHRFDLFTTIASSLSQ